MNTRLMLLKPIGGLCNRLRTISSMYAFCSNNEVNLQVLWEVSPELGARFDQLFRTEDLPFNVVSMERDKSHTMFPSWRSMKPRPETDAHLSPVEFDTLIFNDDFCHFDDQPDLHEGVRRHYEQAINAGKNIYVCSCYDFYNLQEQSYSHFKLTGKLQSKFDAFAEKFDIASCTGIHIRRGDHDFVTSESPLHLYQRYIASIISENPDAKFFLASDDQKIRHTLTDEYGAQFCFLETDELKRESMSGMEVAATELLLLTSCSSVVGNYLSSFALIAARWNGIKFISLGLSESRKIEYGKILPNNSSLAVVLLINNDCHANYIEARVDSFYLQTLFPLEIIVVNNGVSDSAVLEAIDSVSGCTNVVTLDIEQPLFTALTIGIHQTKSEHICILSPQDRISATYLQETMEVFNSYGNNYIVAPSIESIRPGERTKYDLDTISLETNSPYELILRNLIHPASCFSKSLFNRAGGFNQKNRSRPITDFEHGFWMLWFDLVNSGGQFITAEKSWVQEYIPSDKSVHYSPRNEFLRLKQIGAACGTNVTMLLRIILQKWKCLRQFNLKNSNKNNEN